METLIAHPNFAYLRDQIVVKNPATTKIGEVIHQRFADNWPNLKIHSVREDIEHQSITYLADFSEPELFFENYAMIRGILDYYADKVRVIVPYFPVGTMERISEKWEVATAGYFADLLSHLPPGRTHKTSIHTFDIHAPVERHLFNSFHINAELHATKSLLDLPPDTVIAFPDEGAAKRFGKEYAAYDQIICTKIRKGEERIISIKEGNPQGKNILIVDDLIQTGGTIMKTAELLRQNWALQVSAYAAHGVFPGDAHIKVASVLHQLMVTDSIPKNIERAKSVANMIVLSIAPLVSRIIRKD